MFVSTQVARDAAQLARQMGRGEVCAVSVAWTTAGELKPALPVVAAAILTGLPVET